MSESTLCESCKRPLSRDDIGISKKLINRGTQTFYCVPCLAHRFNISEAAVNRLIENFKKAGCTLFR